VVTRLVSMPGFVTGTSASKTTGDLYAAKPFKSIMLIKDTTLGMLGPKNLLAEAI